MKTLRSWLPYLLLVTLALGFQAYRGRELAQGPAPMLVGTTLTGQAFDLAQLRGRPALIYFWATWCGVCKAMQHNIDAIAGDVPLITVALHSGGAVEVSRFLQDRGISIPVLLDEDGAAASRYGIKGVPAVFVLGPDGTIRHTALGYTTELGLRLRLWLARD